MREASLPLAPGALGKLLALAMAAIVYLAMLALAVAIVADRRLEMAATTPVVLDIELPAAEPGRAAANAHLAMLELRQLSNLIALEAGPGAAPYAVEPWSDATPAPVSTTLTVAFAADATRSADDLADQIARAVGRSVIVPLLEDTGLARARDARLLGAGSGAVLLVVAAALSAATTALLARHRRATIEVLIGLGAGAARVARALEAITLRLTLQAATAAALAIAASLLANRWLPTLEALLPMRELAPAQIVLLTVVPLTTTLVGALGARFVAARQLTALA